MSTTTGIFFLLVLLVFLIKGAWRGGAALGGRGGGRFYNSLPAVTRGGG